MQKEFIAKIVRSSKREFDCLILESKELVKGVCLRELLRSDHLVVGDEVKLRAQVQDNRYEIFELITRDNEIFRRIVRSNKKKVIASNVDLILIVCSVSKPDYKPFLVDRYITRAIQWGIPSVIIFNKMDEFDDQFDLEMEQKKFDYLGLNFFEISSVKESSYFQNVAELAKLLRNKTTICLGQSGVGKSRLITELSEGRVELLSSRLAKGILKGAHTTNWAELVDLKKFYMIDSPGVRTLSVSDISRDELPSLFPDLGSYFQQCKFSNCRHEDDSKGCFIHNLDLDQDTDYIVYSRLIAYIKMRDEIEVIPEWQK